MNKNEYFCGWYFKFQSEEESIALIPSYHSLNGEKCASIQLITNTESYNFTYPYSLCRLKKSRPYAQIGENVFSEKGIRLNLKKGFFSASGSLCFGKASPIRFDIMGPFACVPFMECRHRIFSMQHEVNGVLEINGTEYIFKNDVGYIEGDQGRSFPKRYAWTQCNFCGGSVMLAVADIPFGIMNFTGIIGIIQLSGKEYRIATYLGAKAVRIKNNEIIVRQGDFTLTAKLLSRRHHPLFAPENGAMTRTIRENIVCDAHYRLCKKSKVLLDFETSKASFEYEY